MIQLEVNYTWLVMCLWLISACDAYKRSLNNYGHTYVSTTNSPINYRGHNYVATTNSPNNYAAHNFATTTHSPNFNTLQIPTGQDSVAAALLRASLMFDEEGMQYPFYDFNQNDIDKLHTNNYDAGAGGRIQYYPQLSNSPARDVVYGTAKTEEAEDGVIYGRPREQMKVNNYNKDNYDENNIDVNQYATESARIREGSRAMYYQPSREDHTRALTSYNQARPVPYGYYYPQTPSNLFQYHTLPTALVYPTQQSLIQQFKPSEQVVQPIDNLQQLSAPISHPTTTRPQINLDNLDRPLSTTKQQALLTQYFQNIEAQSKDGQEEEEEEKNVDGGDEEEASRYKFGYRITDTVSGMEYGQAEAREGEMTRGHYHVLLPDGRMQHVHYWSDNSGYHATISYDDGPRQIIS